MKKLIYILILSAFVIQMHGQTKPITGTSLNITGQAVITKTLTKVDSIQLEDGTWLSKHDLDSAYANQSADTTKTPELGHIYTQYDGYTETKRINDSLANIYTQGQVDAKLSSKLNTAQLTDSLNPIRASVAGKIAYVDTINRRTVATRKMVDSLILFSLSGKQDSIGTWDASGNLFPSTDVQKGDWWTISVKGFVGGTDSVQVNDLIIAKINNPGQTTTNWIINSAASSGVTVTGQKFNSSTKGVGVLYNGRTPLAGALHGGSAAPVGANDTLNVNGNLYTSGTFTQKTTPNYEGGILGVEKLTSSGWTTTNWTGDFATGFKHTTGNTTALTNTLAAVSGTSYQISFIVTEMNAGSFTITFGGQTSSAYTASSAWGPKATSTGSLSVTPTSEFDGKIIISIKIITAGLASYSVRDNTGVVSYEERFTLATLNNINQGTNAGQSLTTGTYNINQGTSAGWSLTTGSYNINQGTSAGRSLTTGSNNINQGTSAGRYLTTGTSNINQGTSAGWSLTTGSNNINQGSSAGQSLTTGTYNINQGTSAGWSLTTGSYNINQGTNAGQYLTTGSNNINQGTNAGQYLTTGTSNINQGTNAGRYIADGVTTRTTGNNGILIGYNIRASSNGTDNEIAIGSNAIAVGSNTFMLGNSAITGVYNYGSRYGILGTYNYYNAILGIPATNDKRTFSNSYTGFGIDNYASGAWNDSIARIYNTYNWFKNIIKVGNDTVALKSDLTGISGGYTEKTYSELSTLIGANGLIKGNTYKITDRGDRGIFVKAISVNQLAIDATRIMLCPADYAIETDAYSNVWKGVWNSTKSVSINDLVIWGGKVWKNKTGVIGSSIEEDSLDETNWTEITKTGFSNNEYVEIIFGCNYDYANDNITKQWDNNGNIIINSTVYIDYTDWNYATSGYNFSNNVCKGIFNNSNNEAIEYNKIPDYIFNNSNVGIISYNNNSGLIYNNSNTGDISYNSNDGGIYDNSNGAFITYNKNNGDIYSNSNTGGISYNSNTGLIGNNNSSQDNINNNTLDVLSVSSNVKTYIPSLTTTTLIAPVIISKYDTLSSTATVITYNAAVNPFRTDTIGENHTYHINGAVNGSKGMLNVTITSTATLTFPSGVLADGQTFASLAAGVYNICWEKVQGTFNYNIKKYKSYTGY